MPALVERTEILELEIPVNWREGVHFSSPGYLASRVTLDYARWVDMRSPAKIRVEVTPVHEEPTCTCPPGRHRVAHAWGAEPHYVGCPRWGTPIQ